MKIYKRIISYHGFCFSDGNDDIHRVILVRDCVTDLGFFRRLHAACDVAHLTGKSEAEKKNDQWRPNQSMEIMVLNEFSEENITVSLEWLDWAAGCRLPWLRMSYPNWQRQFCPLFSNFRRLRQPKRSKKIHPEKKYCSFCVKDTMKKKPNERTTPRYLSNQESKMSPLNGFSMLPTGLKMEKKTTKKA